MRAPAVGVALLLAAALAAPASRAQDVLPPPGPPPAQAAPPAEPSDAPVNAEDTDPRALSDFRDALDPYGAWVDDPTYGTVWLPSPASADPDFAPYVTGGHWAYDENGDYVWLSDYPWGWVAFHYGRWLWIPGRGWAWVPGRAYSGAWVDWRVGDAGYGFVGWAPMPPGWIWQGGVAVGLGFPLVTPYVFCPTPYLFAPGVGYHIVRGRQVAPIAAHSHRYVAARPSVGRTYARPIVNGPPPSALGIPPSGVARIPPGHVGLARAREAALPAQGLAPAGNAPRAPTITRAPIAPAPRAPTITSAPIAPAPRVAPAPAPVAPAPRVAPAPVAPAPRVAPVAPTPRVAPAPVAPAPRVAPAPVAPAPRVAPAPVAPAPRTRAR